VTPCRNASPLFRCRSSASFLDRVERAAAADENEDGADFRIDQFREALALLDDGRGQRTRRILEALSDPTTEPIASAADMKGAFGAWPGRRRTAGKVPS
jgi:hypothetical protein